MAKLLTDRFVKEAKPKDGPIVWEGRTPDLAGFGLKITPKGKRVFVLQAVYPPSTTQSKRRLGVYPDMTLAEAREKAKAWRRLIAQGIDPSTEEKEAKAQAEAERKQAEAEVQTVADLVENYVARHASTKRTADAIARRLRKNLSGVIGKVTLADLHRRDITRAIDAVMDRGSPGEACRTFEDTRAMIRWAWDRGDLDANVMHGMKRPAEKGEPRDRVLSAEEIAQMWAALPTVPMWPATRRIIRLCLVLGQRVGEVAGMRRDELDLDRAIWTIPGSRTKNAREHQLPLSGMAAAIIREQLAEAADTYRRRGRATGPFLFPTHSLEAPIGAHAVAVAIRRDRAAFGIEPFGCHDLRRTMATHLEELGVSPFVVAHILDHVSVTRGTITSRHYALHAYHEEQRRAMDLWGDRLAAIVQGDGAEIVPLRATGSP